LIIRIALFLIFAAFAVFLSVDLLLWLAVPVLPGLMTRVGLAGLLSAFTILLISGLFMVGKRIIRSCFFYFSAEQRAQRRLWFIQTKQEQIKRLFYFQTLQINYFHELKKNRLLRTNNRRHIQSLSKAIDKDLQTIKKQLPVTAYQQLQKANLHFRKQQDIEALLELQQQIAAMF
jgi:hypothetical protein